MKMYNNRKIGCLSYTFFKGQLGDDDRKKE